MSQSNTAERPLPAPSSVVQRPAKGKATGLTTLGKDATREAQRLATAILEVLAGVRTPGDAAEAVGISTQRYYLLEAQALRGLIQACEPRPRGHVRTEADELQKLSREHERLKREHARYAALVRAAQRTVGLKAAPPAPPKGGAGKAGVKGSGKRKRLAMVRALRAVKALKGEPEGATPATRTAEGGGMGEPARGGEKTGSVDEGTL